MRKTFAIFVMLVCCIMAHAQTGERIFTYDAAGTVVPNTKFIDKQELWNDGVVMTHEADVTVQSSDKAYTYTISLSQIETASGDLKHYDVIDIKCSSKSIFRLKTKEAWDGAYPLDNGSQLGYVTVRYLDVHVTALVFAGWSYAGDAPWIMIVILNKDKATVVFNRRGVIQECTTDNYYGLNLTYADQSQELDDDGNRHPADSELKKFRIWQEGQYLRFAQTQ